MAPTPAEDVQSDQVVATLAQQMHQHTDNQDVTHTIPTPTEGMRASQVEVEGSQVNQETTGLGMKLQQVTQTNQQIEIGHGLLPLRTHDLDNSTAQVLGDVMEVGQGLRTQIPSPILYIASQLGGCSLCDAFEWHRECHLHKDTQVWPCCCLDGS